MITNNINAGIQNYKGLFLPAHETHLIGWLEKVGDVVDGVPAYQYKKLKAALAYVKNFDCVALDVGGHCGTWAVHLAKKFKEVHAFEPVALHRECFALNVKADNCTLHACALGDRDGSVSVHTSNTSSGDSWVSGDGDIPLRIFDREFGNAFNVGFVKLDCEGYEYFALHGMGGMLKTDKPVVLVEQKPGRAEKFGLRPLQACEYLESLGYKRRFVMSGDYLYSV